LANKRGGGSEGRISYEAIKADRKWEGVRTPNFCLGIKADKNRTTAKKLGIFTTISHGLQEKVSKLNLIQFITNP
jgi:hypothetical protein